MRTKTRLIYAAGLIGLIGLVAACRTLVTPGIKTDDSVRQSSMGHDVDIDRHAERMMKEGQETFRYDTFGSEDYWSGELQLHKAILGAKEKGVGPGLTPNAALKAGLKVDIGKLPKTLVTVIQERAISLENPETTVALLRADAVVGVKGFFKDGDLQSVGITCALCHSTVDDSFAAGIGRRLDGWPNRDLNVGAIVAMVPNPKPLADQVGVSTEDLLKVLKSWGPGRYDAELTHDGKALRPDGKTGATLLPAAFGLAGVNGHTYTGWGSVPYWNAYVATTQMHGQGNFIDPRLNDPKKFPVAAKNKAWKTKPPHEDRVTSKLAALHFYQLAIPAPKPEKGTYDEDQAKLGQALFNGKARCATCHVPPLFTEPGYAMHTAEEIGIDDFQASRSPDGLYRTTPLGGLFTRTKGGFYHDGRFKDLPAVVNHYDRVKSLSLTPEEKKHLVEYLKSL